MRGILLIWFSIEAPRHDGLAKTDSTIIWRNDVVGPHVETEGRKKFQQV